MEDSYDTLLEYYRTIWNNRALETAGSSGLDVLNEAIQRELKDENSHPRTRKTPYQKYYTAIKRILGSKLTHAVKLELIELHTKNLESIISEG